jgi:ubiquitin-conjugating enzyme E2 G2
MGKGNSTATRRLMAEYKQLVNDPPEGISAGPLDEDNFFEWECLVQGPEGTPYEGGIFSATLSFPNVSTVQGETLCELLTACRTTR